MKKIIAALFCLTLLVGCFPAQSGIVHSSAKDTITAIESKDSLILVVGKTTCGACDEFRDVMSEIVKDYDIRITEVFLDEEEPVTDESTGNLSYPYFEELEQHIGVIGGSPSVFFIENGVIKGTFTGSVSYDTFKSKLERYGFLPTE